MDQPQPPTEFEVTAVIRAAMNLRIQQLPPQQRTTLFGPRTDAQRLLELELVFAAVQHATKELRARGSWPGIVLISLDGQRFWYLPFSLFPSVVRGLPADALEVLALVEQICAQTDEAAVALLLPDNKIKLLYLGDEGMRGQTYTRVRGVKQRRKSSQQG
ncbi:MAG TPA: hypothetical protein VLA19_19255 [Herpetosiphonaceae bacterium]|nr:hypothetical protein [Herpetosiphonaceae bacterium]